MSDYLIFVISISIKQDAPDLVVQTLTSHVMVPWDPGISRDRYFVTSELSRLFCRLWSTEEAKNPSSMTVATRH